MVDISSSERFRAPWTTEDVGSSKICVSGVDSTGAMPGRPGIVSLLFVITLTYILLVFAVGLGMVRSTNCFVSRVLFFP